MRGSALVLLLVACSGNKRDDPAKDAGAPAAPRIVVPDKIAGKLTLGGKPLEITRCAPDRGTSLHVDLVTAKGTLRWVAYEDARMFWNDVPLACRELRRSWGGATRPDKTTYFRGQLSFQCTGPVGRLEGDLDLDCGNIDAFERKLLDENRRKKLDDQKHGSGR